MNAAVRSAGDDGRALQNQDYAISAAGVPTVVARLRAGEAVPGRTGLTFGLPTVEELAVRRPSVRPARHGRDRRLPAGARRARRDV